MNEFREKRAKRNFFIGEGAHIFLPNFAIGRIVKLLQEKILSCGNIFLIEALGPDRYSGLEAHLQYLAARLRRHEVLATVLYSLERPSRRISMPSGLIFTEMIGSSRLWSAALSTAGSTVESRSVPSSFSRKRTDSSASP